MDVKEAVALAKQHVADLFSGEAIRNLGLEEVQFDEETLRWEITVGFSRPWDSNVGFAAALETHPRRSYKKIIISDLDQRVLSVKNRDVAVA